jgi:hypothetical protein
MTTTKKCHACGVEKPVTDFYKSSSSKDGYAPSCKDCQNGRTPSPKQKHKQPTILEEIALSNAKAIRDQDKSMKSMIKEIKKSKDEQIAQSEWKKANALVNDEVIEDPSEITSKVETKHYHIPKRSAYNGGFTWDQTYGDKKCSVCHQNYKEGEEYVVVARRLDSTITRHVECDKK